MIRSVRIEMEEDWFVAIDDITGIASQGKTKEEAMDNLEEALELYYEEEDIECLIRLN